jgi:hypothetical protein
MNIEDVLFTEEGITFKRTFEYEISMYQLKKLYKHCKKIFKERRKQWDESFPEKKFVKFKNLSHGDISTIIDILDEFLSKYKIDKKDIIFDEASFNHINIMCGLISDHLARNVENVQ